MHEINPQVEQLLRAQGLGDAEIEQLRTTGRVERADGTGGSITIDATPDLTTTSSVVTIDGSKVAGQIPPEALEKLRKFHRFMPAGTIDQLERATGQDIDGDGRIGGAEDAPHETVAEATSARIPTGEHRTSGAMPGQQGGPFVEHNPGRKLLGMLVPLIIVLGAVAWLATR